MTDPTILVINSGSSSLRYRLFTAPPTGEPDRTGSPGRSTDPDRAGEPDRSTVTALAGGTVEQIGEPGSAVADHDAALRQAAEALDLPSRRLVGIGHRVVHGGTRFQTPVRIDDQVLAEIRELARLAPLHNPAGAAGIAALRAICPDVPQVAVFDTAFHATLPPAASTYALDVDLAQRYGIRRYGFHGISHEYVAGRAARLLGRPLAQLNLIVLHLGNGASATAVAAARSVATSMGMTPLEGLVMGTRSGDLDPAITFHLASQAGLGLPEIQELYERRGGLRGLCGDNDLRAVSRRAADGDPAAVLALAVYCHRIRLYVGAYHAVLGRLDAIVFTAGVGENSALVRDRALTGLDALGIVVDSERNHAGTPERLISPDGARVAVCVVPTDEERAIALKTARLLA